MGKTYFVLVILLSSVGISSAKDRLIDSYNLNRAYEEGDKGNKTEALSFFDKELKEHPNNGYAHLGKAGIHYDQKQYDDAIRSLHLALKHLPKKDKISVSTTYYLRGKTLLSITDTIAALVDFKTSISIDPNFSDAYETRGQVYYEQGNFDLANADYLKLIELNPGNIMGYMGVGRNAQAQYKHSEAISQFDRVIAMYPDYSSAFAFRGESYLAKNEYLKAIDDICRALEIDSDRKAYSLMYKFPKNKWSLSRLN